MTAPGAIRWAFGALVLWLGFFAGWSLGSLPLTLACAPFPALWIAAGTGVAGAALSMLSLRPRLAPVLLTPGAMPQGLRLPRGARGLAWAGGLLAFAVAGLAFIVTSNALPIWAVAVALGLAALVERDDRPVRQRPVPPAAEGAGWIGLGLLILAITTLYVLVLRPDGDDAFYVNLPVGLLSQQTCMMAADTMYGTEGWPLLGSNYRVEALPTLTAALSWATGLPAITVAHLLLPEIWCVAWACALAVIGHGLFGRRWWIFATLALLASMALAGTLQTWGVHGIARMFHGKAPLILIVLPLMAFVAARTEASRLAFGPTFAALFGLSAASLGLTANAIYLAPLAVLLSIVAARVAWPGAGWTRLGLVGAAAPPVAAGLWLLLFDMPVSAEPAEGFAFAADLTLWEMASSKVTLALLLATLTLAAVAARVGPAGRMVTAYLVAFLVLALNPVLWPLYDRFVTGGLNFRLWWALPLPTFLAIALTWGVLRSGWIRAGAAVTGAALGVLTLLPSGLIGMEGTRLRPSLHKMPPDVAPVVREVLAAAPSEGTVLAPEEIAAWLPVWEGHPALVYSRRLYLRQSAQAVNAERLAPRLTLADWIAGADSPPPAELRDAMTALEVRLVVLPTDGAPAGAATLLARLGAERQEVHGGYVLHRLPPPDALTETRR